MEFILIKVIMGVSEIYAMWHEYQTAYFAVTSLLEPETPLSWKLQGLSNK
jgi:hypothetical protein